MVGGRGTENLVQHVGEEELFCCFLCLRRSIRPRTMSQPITFNPVTWLPAVGRLVVLSSILTPSDKLPIWNTPHVKKKQQQKKTASLTPLFATFFFISLPSKCSSFLLPSSFLFASMPAHWSLAVLNVRDTFKDAFRSPLIIHTAWIINNISHRAIIQLYHHSPSSQTPQSFLPLSILFLP